MRRSRTSSPAYTLTEMLVVLVIMGMLAAIVGPRLFGRLDDAKTRAAKVQVANLEAAVEMFRIDMGRLPTEEEGLAVLVAPPVDGENWLGPYLAKPELPKDPWGKPFQLRRNGDAYEIVFNRNAERASRQKEDSLPTSSLDAKQQL